MAGFFVAVRTYNIRLLLAADMKKAAQCAALKVVGPAGLEPATDRL
jgi:hypothetical protein